MITGNKELDYCAELAEAILAIPDPAKYSQTVIKAKCEAIGNALSCTEYYRECGIMSELVHAVFRKKMKMIEEADTVADLKSIEKGCIPRFNGNQFCPGPFNIPEEELIMWSLTSLKAPLVSVGFERYTELFRQVFGFDACNCTPEQMDAARKRMEVS